MDSDTDSLETMDQAPPDYGWDEEDTEVEPLPQSVYSGTPPSKAPTPPVRFPGFNWSEPETDYDTDDEEEACDLALSDEQARRSSPFEGGEHTVMEPPFLTHDWEDNHFPQADNASYSTQYEEWDDGYNETTPCYTYMEWAGLWKKTPLYKRSLGVIPGHLFTVVQPRLLRYPAYQRDERRGEYYRQQVITSTDLYRRNIFTDPVQQDMVHYSSTEIPLMPTGRTASLEMDYLLDLQFDRTGQFFSLQLAGEMGRLFKIIFMSTMDRSRSTLQ